MNKQKEYDRKRYLANKKAVKRRVYARLAKLRTDNRHKLIEYLYEHPCIDCGEDDPIVLDFDHKDESTKSADVSQLALNAVWETVEKEILKCDVRCANCHRRRTAKQFGWWKYYEVTGLHPDLVLEEE